MSGGRPVPREATLESDAFLLPAGDKVKLDTHPTRAPEDCSRDEAEALTEADVVRLGELQDLLYADGRHAVLVVLHGIDSAGKDSTIKRVFRDVGPLGCRVENFTAPSPVEAAHDFLWRCHAVAPRHRQLTIFNRSYYEGVATERVKELAPRKRWKRRYKFINQFEQMLASEGTTVLKFFLHISKEEQRERLQERADNPDKHWKFAHSDLADRQLWDDYHEAFDEMLTRCTTKTAPWYVIPSDQKWYRDMIVARIMVEQLEALNLAYPDGEPDIASVVVE